MQLTTKSPPLISLRSTAITALALLLVSAACGRDQDETVALPAGSPCTECDIVLDRVGMLSDSADPGALPDYMVYASRDSAGRSYVISRKKDGVLVFDREGTLVRRLGKSGSGPGEYGVVRRVLSGPGDSIFVTDLGMGRLTVYGPDLNVARTQPIAHQPDLVLADGSFIIAEQIGTKGLIGYPLHRATADGAIIASFGTDTPQYRPDLDLIVKRWAAVSRSGGLWTIAPGRYVIEQWDPISGRRTQTIGVRSQWFKEVAAWPADGTARPPATIETLWEDETGIIWVLLRDADLEWRPPPRSDSERKIGAEEYEHAYDWVLEAIDPKSGTIIATKRFRQILWGRPGSTVLVSASRVTPSGSTYDVWQPRLTPKGDEK